MLRARISVSLCEASIRFGTTDAVDWEEPMMKMEVIVERCAFLDVHRDTVMACARTPDGHGGRRLAG